MERQSSTEQFYRKLSSTIPELAYVVEEAIEGGDS